jgi:hypothetical protein
MAGKADQLWAHNDQHAHDIVATVSSDSDLDENKHKQQVCQKNQQERGLQVAVMSASDKKVVTDTN